MDDVLDQILSELKSLKTGQDELRHGQGELRQRQDVFQQGQDELRHGLDELRQRQDVFQQGQDELRHGQDELRHGQDELRADMSDVKERLVRVEITQENIVLPQIRTIAETHGEIIKGLRRLDAMNEKIDDIQSTVDVLKLVVKRNSQ